jgi:2-polyprenyl-3-methyl-5-hydroxy-6-metoxy-1,4-benzoquinol methylase
MSGEKRDFDAAAATWDEKPARVRMAHNVARTILASAPVGPETDVLDYGCGTGLLSLEIRSHVRSVLSVDSSKGMIEALEAKLQKQGITRVTTLHLDLENDDRIPKIVDLVVSSMTFHHIRDVKALLCRLAEAIRPGGMIAIADLDSDEGKFHESNQGVFHFGFDRSIMKKYFESAGFSDIRSRTAWVMEKTGPDGETRQFSIFLMIGKKPE